MTKVSTRIRPAEELAAERYTDRKGCVVTLSIVAQPVPLSVDPHGTVRVAGTRLTLDTVVDAFKRGDSPQEIAMAFQGLELADVYAIIAYYLRHTSDVEAYLLRQEEKAAAIRQKIEAFQGSQDGLRERLLARRAQKQSS
jgi:uncharacterized protein (DUF433 family)